MDKQQKKAARIKIGILLDDHCDKCPKKISSQTSPNQREKICKGCPVFDELQYLGKVIDQQTTDKKEGKLMPVESAFFMPFDEYFKLKDLGMMDKDIASRKGVPKSTFANWKFKNRERLNELKKKRDQKNTVSEEKVELITQFEHSKPKAPPCPPMSDWERKYTQLEVDYKALVTKAGEMEREFKNEIGVLKRKLDEAEFVDGRDEINSLKSNESILHHELCVQREYISCLENDLSALQAEAKAMRDLLRIKL